MLLKDKDIIVVGLQPLGFGIGSNCIDIATQFSQHNRVLYINYPLNKNFTKLGSIKAFFKSLFLNKSREKLNIVQVDKNIWNLKLSIKINSINWIPSTFLFSQFNFINNVKIANEIKIAINELNFTNYLVFNDSDIFRSYYLNELLKPICSVYYSRDNLMSIPYWYKHGKFIEPNLMRKSNLVCSNSTYLTTVAKKYNPNSFYVGQGCDISLFDANKNYKKPTDLENIKMPIIGYIGVLQTLRLDIDVLVHIAKANFSLVLIGPEDDDFKRSSLHNYPNVYFLGLKESYQLPDYLNYFDVAINPQAVNKTTIGNYPRKIDEYLALGKPIVATNTEAMQIFKNHVYLANNKEEFLMLINRALQENNLTKTNERITFAKSHTWENSVQEIYNAIYAVMPEIF